MIKGYVDHFGWQVEGWAGDSQNESPCIIEIYADNQLIKSGTADLERQDVFEAIGLLKVGFSLNLSGTDDLSGKKFTILARSGNEQLIISEDKFVLGAKVEFGKNQYLFLKNDSNHNDAFLSGERFYSEEEAFNTAALIRARELFFHERGIDIVQAVIPEKSDMLNAFRRNALSIAPNRFIHNVLKAANQVNCESFSYCRDFLSGAGLDGRVFSKTDNHVTDYGIDLLIPHLLGRMLPDIQQNVHIYREKSFRGDLATSLADEKIFELQPCRENRPGVSFEDKTIELIESGQRLTGSKISFINNAPIIDSSVVVIGTSTARAFMYGLADIFRSGVMVWGSTLNYAEIIKLRPRFVLFVLTERFFTPLAIR